MSQTVSEMTDKLQQLKELNKQYQELREELEPWLLDKCDDYLGAWLRQCLETGKPFTLQALKESVADTERLANSENTALWHQLNEVRKLVAIYELRANQTHLSET